MSKQASKQKEKQKNQKWFACTQKATTTKATTVVRLALIHLDDNKIMKHRYGNIAELCFAMFFIFLWLCRIFLLN